MTTTTDIRTEAWWADTYAADHHFNPDHPEFDPDCTCGVTGERPVPRSVIDDPRGDDGTPLPRRTNGDRVRVASPKALGFLASLIQRAERAAAKPSVIELARVAMTSKDPAEVSDAIDDLKKALAKSAPEMTNRYPGDCGTCTAHVKAEAGIVRKVDGRWVTYHGATPDDCPVEAPAAQVATTSPQAAATATIDTTGLADKGYYAVDDKRYRIDAPTKGKWAGWVFVKTGSDYHDQKRLGAWSPDNGWRGSDNGRTILDTVLADPAAAMAAYGRITGRCGRCSRKLEDEASRAAGIGPVCAGMI